MKLRPHQRAFDHSLSIPPLKGFIFVFLGHMLSGYLGLKGFHFSKENVTGLYPMSGHKVFILAFSFVVQTSPRCDMSTP